LGKNSQHRIRDTAGAGFRQFGGEYVDVHAQQRRENESSRLTFASHWYLLSEIAAEGVGS
jgi:hypothetical protein